MSAPNKSYDPVAVTALSEGEVQRTLDSALAAIAAAGDLDELKAARLRSARARCCASRSVMASRRTAPGSSPWPSQLGWAPACQSRT